MYHLQLHLWPTLSASVGHLLLNWHFWRVDSWLKFFINNNNLTTTPIVYTPTLAFEFIHHF